MERRLIPSPPIVPFWVVPVGLSRPPGLFGGVEMALKRAKEVVLAPVAGEVLEKPRKPGTFGPGPDSRRWQEKVKLPIPERVEVVGAGLLRTMRSVMANHEKRDVGLEEKAARKWFKKDQKSFLLKLHELEVLDRKEEAVVSGEEDVSEGEILAELDRLLVEVDDAVAG